MLSSLNNLPREQFGSVMAHLLECAECLKILKGRFPLGGTAPFRQQGWQDSNPRPAVLETAALPAELHPYKKKRIKRETGFEPATSSLGSWRSTTELLPHLVSLPYTMYTIELFLCQHLLKKSCF